MQSVSGNNFKKILNGDLPVLINFYSSEQLCSQTILDLLSSIKKITGNAVCILKVKIDRNDILAKMCDIIGIKKEVIKENELNSIGAQYLMKGITHYFWDKVEKDSEILFKEITELNDEKIIEDRRTMPPGEERTPYHPLQIWCADMWAVLWNGWKMGYKTIPSSKFNFTWATGTKTEFEKNNIFHNAGIVNGDINRFYKGKYTDKLPYGDELNIIEDSASLEYWKYIQSVGKKSVLI